MDEFVTPESIMNESARDPLKEILGLEENSPEEIDKKVQRYMIDDEYKKTVHNRYNEISLDESFEIYPEFREYLEETHEKIYQDVCENLEDSKEKSEIDIEQYKTSIKDNFKIFGICMAGGMAVYGIGIFMGEPEVASQLGDYVVAGGGIFWTYDVLYDTGKSFYNHIKSENMKERKKNLEEFEEIYQGLS